MKRIAIDMDDVMADTSVKIVAEINKRLNKSYNYQDLFLESPVKYEFYQDYLANNSFLHDPGFFLDIPVKDNAPNVLKSLANHYEIFIVSAATEFPNSMKEKIDWMQVHFPFISWTNIVFCGHKHMIQADYLIDDHEKNLKTFTGTPILFTAPHNIMLTGYDRVDNWNDVKSLFL